MSGNLLAVLKFFEDRENDNVAYRVRREGAKKMPVNHQEYVRGYEEPVYPSCNFLERELEGESIPVPKSLISLRTKMDQFILTILMVSCTKMRVPRPAKTVQISHTYATDSTNSLNKALSPFKKDFDQ